MCIYNMHNAYHFISNIHPVRVVDPVWHCPDLDFGSLIVRPDPQPWLQCCNLLLLEFMVSLLTFFSGCSRMMYSFGEYRQISDTYPLYQYIVQISHHMNLHSKIWKYGKPGDAVQVWRTNGPRKEGAMSVIRMFPHKKIDRLDLARHY